MSAFRLGEVKKSGLYYQELVLKVVNATLRQIGFRLLTDCNRFKRIAAINFDLVLLDLD